MCISIGLGYKQKEKTKDCVAILIYIHTQRKSIEGNDKAKMGKINNFMQGVRMKKITGKLMVVVGPQYLRAARS